MTRASRILASIIPAMLCGHGAPKWTYNGYKIIRIMSQAFMLKTFKHNSNLIHARPSASLLPVDHDTIITCKCENKSSSESMPVHCRNNRYCESYCLLISKNIFKWDILGKVRRRIMIGLYTTGVGPVISVAEVKFEKILTWKEVGIFAWIRVVETCV